MAPVPWLAVLRTDFNEDHGFKEDSSDFRAWHRNFRSCSFSTISSDATPPLPTAPHPQKNKKKKTLHTQ